MDFDCIVEAENNNVPNPGSFRAFVATDEQSAVARLGSSGSATWYRVDGVELFTSTMLNMGTTLAALDVDPSGAYVHSASAWTGAKTTNVVGTATCGDWSSSSASTKSIAGQGEDIFDWFDNTGVTVNCSDTTQRLYCLEQ